MKRAVVTVATGPYVKGARRLIGRLSEYGENMMGWLDYLPKQSPSHRESPYAFKATALREAAEQYEVLLWCDACIWPAQKLDRLWEKIERDGCWIHDNGFRNSEWTADSALAALFPTEPPETARQMNRTIPHVVATAFGLSTAHPRGRAILREYLRLATETAAFRGPWTNGPRSEDGRTAPCGDPAEVRGHRHDQTALSVIAWRNNVRLTRSPDFFAYGKAGSSTIHPDTILVADGDY